MASPRGVSFPRGGKMQRCVKAILMVAAFVILLPISALAQQGQIAGTVRDAQGAVMPGVLVEVTSPALIEKVRSSTTDASGQYRIINLPVGTYSVGFTLEGFTKQQQNGVVLTTGFTAVSYTHLRAHETPEHLVCR